MNEQLDRWDDLKIVLAVARTGSLSGAARALSVSHPTVFRRVNRIEARLGVRLFERGRDGYAATPAGEELAALAARVEGEVTDAERRLAGRDLRPSGTVRLTTTDTLLFGVLSPLLARCRAAHPEIRLVVTISNEFLSLSRRDADVAVRPSRDVPENLVGRRVGSIAMAPYAHRELAAAGAGEADPGAFAWVGTDESLSYLPMAGWLRERGLEDRVVYRANTLFGCAEAVRNRIGAGVLLCFLGDRDPDLVRLGPPIEALASELWLLTHPDLRGVARIRAVLDWLSSSLRPLRPLLAGGAPDSSASHPASGES